MKEFIAFVKENTWLVILIVAIACIIVGRIWSNIQNWGDITDPKLIMKKGKNYKVINLYTGKEWTEDWVVGSIICLKIYHHRFFVKYSKELYISGDRLRFDDNGPDIGQIYQAVFPRSINGIIVMKPIQATGKK